MPSYVPMDM